MSTEPLKRILYAEDEPDIREIAVLALESFGGFEVITCESGTDADRSSPALRKSSFNPKARINEVNSRESGSIMSSTQIQTFSSFPGS